MVATPRASACARTKLDVIKAGPRHDSAGHFASSSVRHAHAAVYPRVRAAVFFAGLRAVAAGLRGEVETVVSCSMVSLWPADRRPIAFHRRRSSMLHLYFEAIVARVSPRCTVCTSLRITV